MASPNEPPAEGSGFEILVENTTTLQIAEKLLQQGFEPLVLDMANRSSPGGSVLAGSNAQEETLCRQSNLYPGLQKAYMDGHYPIPECGGILVKNVTFFRDENYDLIAAPFQISVFASAAYDCNSSHWPDLDNHLCGYDRPESDEDYEKGTKAKMRALLEAAQKNGNDALVLSAFGCGAFKNNPALISQWYKQVLNEPRFKNSFKVVVFAIKDNVITDIFKNNFRQ